MISDSHQSLFFNSSSANTTPQGDSRLNAVTQLLRSVEKNRQNYHHHPSSQSDVNNMQHQHIVSSLTPVPQPIDHSQLDLNAHEKALERQRQAQSTYGKYSDTSGYYGYLYNNNNSTNNNENNTTTTTTGSTNNNYQNQNQNQNQNQQSHNNKRKSTSSSAHHHHRDVASSASSAATTDSCSIVSHVSSRWSDIDSLPEDERSDLYEMQLRKLTKQRDEARRRATENAGNNSSREYVFTASHRKPESPELSKPRKRSARPDDNSSVTRDSFQAMAAHKRRQAEAEIRALRYDELLRQPLSPNQPKKIVTIENNNNSSRNNKHEEYDAHHQSSRPQGLLHNEPLQRREAKKQYRKDFDPSSPTSTRKLQQLQKLQEQEDELVRKHQQQQPQQQPSASSVAPSLSSVSAKMTTTTTNNNNSEEAGNKRHVDPALLDFVKRQHQHHQILRNENSQERMNIDDQNNTNNNNATLLSSLLHDDPSLGPSATTTSKMVFDDRDGSFLQVAMPSRAHETQDHRTTLLMMAQNNNNNTTKNKQRNNHYYYGDNEEEEYPDVPLPVAMMRSAAAASDRSDSTSSSKFDYSKNPSFVEVKQSQLLNHHPSHHEHNNNYKNQDQSHHNNRPQQHRVPAGVNDSFAFAEKSRLTTKQEQYNNPEYFQQNSLAGKELSLHQVGQVEQHGIGDMKQNDPTNTFAPDLALAQRDFASRAQQVRQKVTETRIMMALKAVRDTEDRERLMMRVAETIERGTHSLLVNHLGNRIKMIAEEVEERNEIFKIRQRDLLMVGRRVRFRKEQQEGRKQILDEQDEKFLKLKKNLQTTLKAHHGLVDLVKSEEPRQRQFLVSECIDSMNFLILRSCEIMEEKNRAFLIVGHWCASEESLREVQEQFEDYFESASQRRMRSVVRGSNNNKKNNNNSSSAWKGWIGPSVPTRGQFCDDFDDAVVSSRNDHLDNVATSFFTRMATQTAAAKAQQQQQNRNMANNNKQQQQQSDAEVIFAELNRAARRISASSGTGVNSSSGRMSNSYNNNSTRHLPLSPPPPPQKSSIKNTNSNNNNSIDSNKIDQENSLHPLWSSSENLKRAQLSAQIAALRRGEDLPTIAFAARHYQGPQGFLLQQNHNSSNDNNSGSSLLDANYYETATSSDSRPLWQHSSSSLSLVNTPPDNFASYHHHHRGTNNNNQDQHQHQNISIATLDGLALATTAILNWHGWLPISVYYSIIIPYARLLRDEAVSRLALQEGEQVRLQSLIATKALDIGQRMTRALQNHEGDTAMKLAQNRIAQVPVRLFGMMNNNSNKHGSRRNSPSNNNNGNNEDDDNQQQQQQPTNAASIALQHDLRLFRLADPDRQGFVSYPSVIAVLRSSPDLVGVGKDVFKSCSNEELMILFRQSSSSSDDGEEGTNNNRHQHQDTSSWVLTFPEFREFMQTLRQMMVYHSKY